MNDSIVARQRQIRGAVLPSYERQKPDRAEAPSTPNASVVVKRVRRNFAPVVEVVSRSVGRIAELERELVVAYNTPTQNDEVFLEAARHLAEALMADDAP